MLLAASYQQVTTKGFFDSQAASLGVDSTWAFQNQNQQNTGFSPQTIINASNVASLVPVWTDSIGGLSGTPVVSNGIVYVTGSSAIWAINESTGKMIWVDGPTEQTGLSYTVRVGVTIDHGVLFSGTNHNLLVWLNATTGSLIQDVNVTLGVVGDLVTYGGLQATPLVFNDKVIVGETNGDCQNCASSRGLVRAFNETNGKLLWTFYTVPPAPVNATNQAFYGNSWGTNHSSCACSGGAVWNLPAVDPNTGIIYFGTGNPSPQGSNVKYRVPMPNSTFTNLYTDSIIALNSTDGNMTWHFQMVPGDQRDYDQGMPVQLFNTTINNVSTEVVGAGSKIGYYFAVSAVNGAFLWKTKIGLHMNENSTVGSYPSNKIIPGSDGGVDSFSAFNPLTNMIYTTAYNENESCDISINSCTVNSQRNATFYALNASNGSIAWSRFMPGPALGGGASTTNDLVFTADGNHNFYVMNATNGNVLSTRHDTSGGGVTWYWSWGAPSIVNGMLFTTTMGSSTTGKLEAFALPSEITSTSSSTSSTTGSSTTTTTTTTTSNPGPVFDGSDGIACTTQACAATKGLTTANSNDLVLVCTSSVSGRTVTSIKDSAAKLTFTRRSALTQANGPRVELWTAPAASTLSSDKLTVTFSAAGADSFTTFAVSGANLANPIDASHTNGWSDTVREVPNATLTTTNSHDLLVGCETTNVALTQKAGSGFTLVQALSHTGESSAAEFQVVSSTQSNLDIRFGIQAASTNRWAMVVAGIA